VNRVEIIYGGQPYSLGGRSLDSIQTEIEGAVASGHPWWLKVNSGGGRFEDAYLLITPGTSIALLDVRPDGEEFAEFENTAALDSSTGFNHESV
jgi:hypothetical protein